MPVVGDLALQKFGLSEAQWDELAEEVHVIFHSASMVNFLYPYRALKNANVKGAEEVLRLAATTRIKAVHFVSTLSTYAHGAHLEGTNEIKETDPLAPASDLFGGYTQTKWVSERIAMLARDAGLPLAIYRPGRITGHAQSGVGNVDDFMCRMIKGCVQLGLCPKLAWEEKCAGVDFCADTIALIGGQQDSVGHNYHLVHHEAFKWSDMFDWIVEFGFPLDAVPYEEWTAALSALGESGKSNAMYALLPLLNEANGAAAVMPTFDCSNVTGRIVGRIECPRTDQALMDIFLAYFVRCGFLEAPEKGPVPQAYAHGGAVGEVGNPDGFMDEGLEEECMFD